MEWVHPLDNTAPSLSAVKSFLIDSNAFVELRAKLWHFVDPSLKFRLNSISTELEGVGSRVTVAPGCFQGTTCASPYCNEKRTNVYKKAVEDYTGVTWDWWPLKQCRPEIPAGCKRLYWQCFCGEDRVEDVPMFFADQIVRKQVLQPQDLPTSNPQIPTRNGAAPPPTGHSLLDCRQTMSTSSTPRQHYSSSQQSSTSILTYGGQGAQTAAKNVTDFALYVLLGVAVGDDLCLKRIDILDYRDDKFFEQLRDAYIGAKGLLRGIFGIWVYSHCDFFKFEKFDEEEIAPCGPGIPALENKDYQ